MSRTPLQPAMLAIAVALAGTPGLSAATLATDGEPQMTIVLAEGAIAAERTAAEQVAAAKAVLAVKEEAARAKLPRLAESYARSTLALAEGPETLGVTIQALRIGDLAVCTIPFETFVEIGLELKKRSPFARTMVISIANGYHGYLPTPEQHKLGGYETWLGTCKVREDSSVVLTDQLLEMLAALAKEK